MRRTRRRAHRHDSAAVNTIGPVARLVNVNGLVGVLDCPARAGAFSSLKTTMKPQRPGIATLSIAIALVGGVLVSGQSVPNEPRRTSGSSVTGAFEGWFSNPDGSYSF